MPNINNQPELSKYVSELKDYFNKLNGYKNNYATTNGHTFQDAIEFMSKNSANNDNTLLQEIKKSIAKINIDGNGYITGDPITSNTVESLRDALHKYHQLLDPKFIIPATTAVATTIVTPPASPASPAPSASISNPLLIAVSSASAAATANEATANAATSNAAAKTDTARLGAIAEDVDAKKQTALTPSDATTNSAAKTETTRLGAIAEDVDAKKQTASITVLTPPAASPPAASPSAASPAPTAAPTAAPPAPTAAPPPASPPSPARNAVAVVTPPPAPTSDAQNYANKYPDTFTFTEGKKVIQKITDNPTKHEINPWVTQFMNDGKYRIYDNMIKVGDCFFASIQFAFESIGLETSVTQLRRLLLSSTDIKDRFEYYKDSYNNHKNDNNNDYNFMTNVNELDKFKEIILTSEFWADEWAIDVIEKELNIQLIILNKHIYNNNNNNSDAILLCGALPKDGGAVNNPDYYIMLSYNGNHYQTIGYDGNYIFKFSKIPDKIKDLIVVICMQFDEGGDFNLIQDFKDFKARRISQ